MYIYIHYFFSKKTKSSLLQLLDRQSLGQVPASGPTTMRTQKKRFNSYMSRLATIVPTVSMATWMKWTNKN